MSKAFTRESDDSGAEELPIPRRTLPAGTRNYITREGAERLRRQLNELLESRQRLRTAEIAGADPGTVQRKLDAAIRSLQETLGSVVIAEIPPNREKVAFGAEVVIRRGGGGQERYRIVGVDEADPESGAISWLSPLARALLSRRAGDQVRFRGGFGEEEVIILSVSY